MKKLNKIVNVTFWIMKSKESHCQVLWTSTCIILWIIFSFQQILCFEIFSVLSVFSASSFHVAQSSMKEDGLEIEKRLHLKILIEENKLFTERIWRTRKYR